MVYEDLLKINIDVSRETFEKLKIYHETLLIWQEKYNLIAKSTIPNSWHRHFIDSAQIVNYIDPSHKNKIIDLGSGAGFPGAVVSILTKFPILLIEENHKKINFLNEVKTLTKGCFKVVHKKIEELRNIKAQLVICRALKPLSQLLEYSQPLLEENTQCLFLKGKRFLEEVTEAEKFWNFDYEKIPSLTDCQAYILRVQNIERKNKGSK